MYHPNPSKIDSTTTQKHDYPAWPDVKPPAQRPKAKYTGSSGKFEGETTTKHDYRDFGVQPVYVHPTPVYVKNEAKFEGQSSNQSDYKNWGSYQTPPPRAKAEYVASRDDRYFFRFY